MKVKQKTKQKNSFPIVGIGASAGGLKAFTQLIKAIPSDIGMAFVLVQHLDPTKKSLLSETLARTTKLPFIEVTDGIKISNNHIYAMPSESYMTITDHTLRLTPRKKSDGIHKPIDDFFQSLAKHHGKDAIGIVLSGMANDGTKGIQAIKESGGRTFAQDDSAQFKDMPQNAIDSGSIDFILSPEEIARTLFQISHNLINGNRMSKPEKDPTIDAVLAIIHTKTGMDFRQYKATTVNRRIQRRMLLSHIETVKEYAAFLIKNPSEVEALRKDMLIRVTSFFREPAQFEVLKTLVLPALQKDRSTKKPINVWIAGCATGEEAYSYAILFQEFFGKKTHRIPVKIFATDIAKDAISEASKGIYKENITEYVSPIRIRKFFTKVTGGYEIKKLIRDMCEFAVADVTQKPPHLNFDLISCRNVLIYLGEALQQKAFFMLSSALKPDGFLLLGKSEDLGASAKLFSQVDNKQKIYSKKAITSVTHDLRTTINAQVGMSTSPLSSQKATIPGPDDTHAVRQQKIIKLKEAVALTQEYADEIMNELDVMNEVMQSANEELTSSGEELQTANEEMTTLNEEVTIARDYADAIIRTVRGPLLVLSKNLRIISANESFYNAFKVVPSDTENKLLYDLGNRQWNIPKLKTLLEKILPKNNTLTDYEVVHDFKDIGQKTMLLNARTLRQGPNKTSLILLAIEDITDRKKAEKVVKQSEKFFRTANKKMIRLNEEVKVARDYADAIIKTVRESLVILDGDLRVKSANESFYKTFKVRSQETENRVIYDLGNKQWDIPMLRTLLEKILPEKNTIEDFIVEHDFESIGHKTMLLNTRTLLQGTNKTPLILLAIEDITDRKKAEKALEHSEGRLRFMAESIPQKIFTADSKGHIDYFNPVWMEYTGLSFEKIRDLGWLQFIHPDDREKNMQAWQHSIDTGKPFEFIHRFRHKDGAYRWHMSRARPMRDEKGNIIKWFGSNTDIDEQKNALEHRDEFIGIASHELKTPLTSVKAYTQILQSRFRKAEDMKSIELVSKMDAQLDKLTNLIGDLLDVTKVEAGRLQFHETFFDFNEFVIEIVEEMQRTTDKYKVIKELQSTRTVYGDRDRLGQVVTNFMTNAIKYSPHSDKIIVKTVIDRENVTLSVRDFGIGLSQVDQTKVFERFYRVSGSDQDTYPGLGLGLYISAEIIKRQNGKAWVESKKGKGSTFYFSLQIRETKIKQQTNTIAESSENHRRIEEQMKHE